MYKKTDNMWIYIYHVLSNGSNDFYEIYCSRLQAQKSVQSLFWENLFSLFRQEQSPVFDLVFQSTKRNFYFMSIDMQTQNTIYFNIFRKREKTFPTYKMSSTLAVNNVVSTLSKSKRWHAAMYKDVTAFFTLTPSINNLLTRRTNLFFTLSQAILAPGPLTQGVYQKLW